MFFQIQSFLTFLYNSKNQHGVHSPFVFNLITKCLYDKRNYSEFKKIECYRKSLLINKKNIEVNDFGVGSKIFKTNNRQISKIAKTAGISFERAKLLFKITNYFKPESILEIGTSLGLSTHAMALGNRKAEISTIEGCFETLSVAKTQLKIAEIENVTFVNAPFSKFLALDNLKFKNFELIYFDGNHSKVATLDYFNRLLPTITNESVWIFDDIHWSASMESAWEEIKKHSKVTVTIDTFRWGIVFFRTEQAKEHFVIRV